MDKYRTPIRIVSNLLLLLAIVFFLVALFGTKTENEAPVGDFSTMEWNDNWTMTGDISLQNITLPLLLDNDNDATITLVNTLPAYITDGMRLSFRTALSDVRISIGGELRSEYISDNFSFVENKLPSAYIVLDLSDEDAGKTIEIEHSVKGNIKLNEIRIGYGNNIWFMLLSQNIFVIAAAIILICGGFLAVLFFFTLGRTIHSDKAVLYLGQAMIVIGLWILSESHIRQLIFQKPSYSAVFAYILCELIGGFIALYFNEVQKYKYNTLYISMELLMFGQALINTLLHFTGLVRFYDTLMFSHIWLILSAIVFLVTVILDTCSGHIRTYSITAWGMLLFIFFCGLEMIDFYIRDFFVLGKYICIGLIVLLIATLIQTIHDEMLKIRWNADLEREKEAAVSANLAKTEFLANMSHEIRTPVNAVIGMTEMILRESTEDTIVSYASDVKHASTTLLTIINDILDTTKIEAGKLELVPANYELGVILRNLYNMSSLRAKEKGLELNFNVNPTLPCSYYGDDKRIQQILINLLTNAIKYTNHGSVSLTVNGTVKEDTAILRFCVQDTGIGIREENLEKLYGKFERLDIDKNRNIEGIGLGMYIVKQLLLLMDSEIQIQSEYGKGSSFSFELCQKITDTAPLGDFHQKIPIISENKLSSFRAPNARILVVDDNPINIKIIKNLLKNTGIQISEATNGKECLKQMWQETFDLVFLDHMMPEMDGIETFHILKKEKLCENTPIIMFTANALLSQQKHYQAEGFDGFLSKPVLTEQLDEILRKYLSEEPKKGGSTWQA